MHNCMFELKTFIFYRRNKNIVI
uniref:Uncharacterized protein n=1 Tax=Lepeophtheirus salmonis TaxID=72036 RepID=A0A0K2V9A5_LEPSM